MNHNPDNLTDEQIDTKDGWRLLTKQEISEGRKSYRFLVEIECWSKALPHWSNDSFLGVADGNTYRTKLTSDQLKERRACSPAK